MMLLGVDRFIVENKIYFIKKEKGIQVLHIKNVM